METKRGLFWKENMLLKITQCNPNENKMLIILLF